MMNKQKRHEIYSSLGQFSKAGVDRLNCFGLGENDCRVSEKPDCTADSHWHQQASVFIERDS